MDDIAKYLTVRQSARKLGITEEWVRDLIAKKEIKAVKIGQWKIKPSDLRIFIQKRSNFNEQVPKASWGTKPKEQCHELSWKTKPIYV